MPGRNAPTPTATARSKGPNCAPGAFSLLDRDGDGRIEPVERKAYWLSRKAKVNTPVERKYDADGDGFLSGDEAREMLRARLALVRTHGQAKVDSALEAEYDDNDDGVIDAAEAKDLAAAVED